MRAINKVTTEEKRAKNNARVRAWKKANPERAAELNASSWERRKARDPSLMERARQWSRKRYEKFFRNKPEAIRKQNLQQLYGLTLAGYDALLEAQGGVCAICGTDKPGGRGKNFNVDHDHRTGKVRGLLCTHCNKSLGNFRDNPVVLARALNYLLRGGSEASSAGDGKVSH